MSDEPVQDHVQSLWQGQPAEGSAMSLDELRHRSQRLARIVTRRNRREYIAAVIAVLMFGPMAWFAPLTLTRVGAVVTLAAVMFVVYHLHRFGSAQPMPEEMGLTSCLSFHRRELERQRDLLRSVWLWALLPLVPGGILIGLGPALAHPEHASRGFWLAAAILLFFVLIGELNRHVANKIQARMDALERDV
jgi:hypothetical protein